MRIVGILEDNNHAIVGYVLFNRRATNPADMFKVFEKDQVRFLIQSYGIENAELDYNEIVITENAISRLPHYNNYTKQTSEPNALYVIICEKLATVGGENKNPQYHIIAMGNNLGQIKLQTVDESNLLASASNNLNFNLVNAKVVEKSGKLILQGIKKPIAVQTIEQPVKATTIEAPKAKVEKETVTKTPQQKSIVNRAKQLAKEKRYKRAEEKLLNAFSQKLAHFCESPCCGIYGLRLPAQSEWPARSFITLAKVFVNIVKPYCSDTEINRVKKAFQYIKDNELEHKVIVREKACYELTYGLKEGDKHYKQFYQSCFVIYSAIAKHPEFQKLMTQYNNARARIPKYSISEEALNYKYSSEEFKTILKNINYCSFDNIKYDIGKVYDFSDTHLNERHYKIDKQIENVRYLYTVIPVFYKCKEWAYLANECNKDEYGDLLIFKQAYNTVKRLTNFENFGLYESESQVQETLKDKLRYYIQYLRLFNKKLYGIFTKHYEHDLKAIFNASDVEDIQYVSKQLYPKLELIPKLEKLSNEVPGLSNTAYCYKVFVNPWMYNVNLFY